ncbi:neutral/alkaline non-lysosomal ceramidase N-terminal domain-containing protein [Algoriphagus boritolerans]|uniref:neutral/alkaline non-lysosomal ceramidase N-terminal domain-containing protein n=1 Tax=Algoriphagus boritolerans TaxID=308111 RepID=UPI000B048444
MSRFLKILSWTFAVLLLIALATITTVDRSPIEKQNFYQETFERLEKNTLARFRGRFLVGRLGKSQRHTGQTRPFGWLRTTGPYEFVQDSSFVKAITLSNGKTQIAWLNFELLIVHPVLAKAIEEGIANSGVKADQLIFTATHTHSGMGGYMPGVLGNLAFGGYDQKTVDHLVNKSIEALQTAISSQDTASLSYRKVDAGKYVANRFIKDAPYDPFVRQLIFTKKSGEKAVFFHLFSTCYLFEFEVYGFVGRLPQVSQSSFGGP